MSRDLVLASGNKGKLAELQSLLADSDFRLIAQSELGVEDAIEDGLSFIENALIKARHAARVTGKAAIADDSGLCVDALGGAPGIHSARFAGEHGNDAKNNALLLERLQQVPDDQRGAQFVCVLAMVRHADDPLPLICEGYWRGRILRQPQGDQGFGYDPLFLCPDQGASSAELERELKNRISHRARALQALLQRLPNFLDPA